jgi:hypothetical protein
MGRWQQIASVHNSNGPKNVEFWNEAQWEHYKKKWSQWFPSPLNLKCKDVYVKTRVKKDVGFIWMLWHQIVVVVVVNV